MSQRPSLPKISIRPVLPPSARRVPFFPALPSRAEGERSFETNGELIRRRSFRALFFRHRQAMIDEFDLDQDGEISLEEFFAIMVDGD